MPSADITVGSNHGIGLKSNHRGTVIGGSPSGRGNLGSTVTREGWWHRIKIQSTHDDDGYLDHAQVGMVEVTTINRKGCSMINMALTIKQDTDGKLTGTMENGQYIWLLDHKDVLRIKESICGSTYHLLLTMPKAVCIWLPENVVGAINRKHGGGQQ